MERNILSRRGFSSLLFYLNLAWTLFCFLGVGFVILQYGVLKGGLIAVIVTFFFAATIWAIPFSGLVLFHLYLSPTEKLSSPQPGLPGPPP
ncbi:MAG: hypothetical protein EHM36_09110 [Deltaproteobacteria bacterium]|nr:MAG: hypothetical protein EHM36_09110 [Deltaproteobacteria bacterium]